MRKILFLLAIQCLGSLLYAQTPLARPALWLRADRCQPGDTLWRDARGESLHAIPSAGILPATTLMNFNPALPLRDGSRHTVPIDSLPSERFHVIAVYGVDDPSVESGLWTLRTDSATRVGLTTHHILNGRSAIALDSASVPARAVNCLSHPWKPAGSRGILTAGGADSLALSGALAEFLFFDHVVGDTALLQWSAYAAIKYGITLYESDYLDGLRRKVWDRALHPAEPLRVAGVGQDSLSGLDQRQTFLWEGEDAGGGFQGSALFGLGSPAIDNASNPAAAGEGVFILLGLDSGGFSNPSLLEIPGGGPLAIRGNGRAQATGDPAKLLPTFLAVDIRLAGDSACPALAPKLLIDRSGTGGYPEGMREEYLPVSIDSNGLLLYAGIFWDTDGNGTDAFCFALPLDSLMGGSRSATAGNTAGKDGGGVNSPDPVLSLSLYPNPNHGEFSLRVEQSSDGKVEASLFSAEGRFIKALDGGSGPLATLRGTAPSPGNFLVKVAGDGWERTLKMTVF